MRSPTTTTTTLSSPPTPPHSDMAWALYLTTGASPTVTDDQLAELDEFELVSRGSPSQVIQYLHQRIAHIIHALVCVAGAMPGRSQMLRSVTLLQSILDLAVSTPPILRLAIQGLAKLHLQHVVAGRVPGAEDDEPTFLQPLVSIAVKRVSDKELAGAAAACLGTLLGCPSFDRGIDDKIPESVCAQANEQTRRLVELLITEISLTASPVALAALSSLLRRDFARVAFCDKDGTSTLAWTLSTHPAKTHTAVGELVASSSPPPAGVLTRPVVASYYAVFAVWMLTFAVSREARELVLTSVLSSRLLVVLARLLNHSSGQRLKIARVTLSSLRNLASGFTVLHSRVRKDLLAAEVPAVLQKLLIMGSGRGALLGNDEDAMDDARVLSDLLAKESETMSTLDDYLAEVKACALHWSPVHNDVDFWVRYAQRIVDEHRDVLVALTNIITAKQAPPEEIAVACNDLSNIMQESVNGKAALLSVDGFKHELMNLMTTHQDPGVRAATLPCIQHLVMTSRPKPYRI